MARAPRAPGICYTRRVKARRYEGRGESFALVVNPQAGAGRAGRLLPALEAALRGAGADFTRFTTEGPGHATELTRQALRDGASGVAVVGGDGTLGEALNGFFLSSGAPIAAGRWLGPLPAGTGGDFRRSLGMEARAPADLVRRLLLSEPRPIDCGWVEFVDAAGLPSERAFLNIASFGLAGMVDEAIATGPKYLGGRAAYFLASVQAKARYGANRRVRLRLDGRTEEHHVLNLAVANGRYFGGGMHIAPDARLDDGLLDVVSIEREGWLGPLALSAGLYGAGVLGRPGVRHGRGRSVSAEALPGEPPVLLDIDGEAPGRLPARFDVRPGALALR